MTNTKTKSHHLPNLRSNLYFSTFLIVLILLTSCNNDDDENFVKNQAMAGGYSIAVKENNVLISGFESKNRTIASKFWVNTESVDVTTFDTYIANQTLYRKSVDDSYRKNYIYKDLQGKNQNYQFDQGSLAENGKVFYYKNNVLTFMENDSTGTVSSVAFHNDKPYFAGYFGKITPSEGGDTLRPQIPFIWDGDNTLVTLALPDQTSVFQGISAIYVEDPNSIYVSGHVGVPMYWKNTDPVILDDRYGEIWEITRSGNDIYAVGLINKHNSNSTGHTACYWKNGELHELEDNAQAYGIFVDGNDIYVCGAIGTTPIDYTPCYWKNGVRMELPI